MNYKPTSENQAKSPKVAIVHDWLTVYSGAERVLEEILKIYPDADLYSLLDFIPSGERDFIQNKSVKTSFLQKFPFAKKKYRHLLLFMPFAIERFDLSSYDIIISSSHAVAKGVKTHKNQVHISYFNAMMDYVWWLSDFFLKASKLDKGLKSVLVKMIFRYIRNWDKSTKDKVDFYIANSNYMAQCIKKIYGRESTIIYPPVDIDKFKPEANKDEYYVVVSRLVYWKRIDIIAQAFSRMPDKKLIIIGDGPEMEKIRSVSGKNIELLGFCNSDIVAKYLARARALINASVEPFGIGIIEAQACGTPVIAFNKGGALETVIENKTGIFFKRQHPDDIVETVKNFEKLNGKFDHNFIHNNALKFSNERFRTELKSFADKTIRAYFNSVNQPDSELGKIEQKRKSEITKTLNAENGSN